MWIKHGLTHGSWIANIYWLGFINTYVDIHGYSWTKWLLTNQIYTDMGIVGWNWNWGKPYFQNNQRGATIFK